MKKINVYINSYLEYMNSILLTSRYNEITEPYIGYGLMTKEENEYTTRIKHFLEKYHSNCRKFFRIYEKFFRQSDKISENRIDFLRCIRYNIINIRF